MHIFYMVLRIFRFNSAVSRIQAVLIIAVIIVAAVAVGYLYQSQIVPPKTTPTPSPTTLSPTPTAAPTFAPLPATLKVSNLFIDPIEAWINQPINVSVNVQNTGKTDINYSLPFKVDGNVVQSALVQLAPHESSSVTATLNESSLGSYRATVSGLGTTFKVVETGKHTLHVVSGRTGFSFI